MTIQERRAGLVLVVLGVLAAYYGFSVLKVGTVSQPGPGFFPFISGAGITILCLFWILTNRVSCSQPLWRRGELVRPVLATALTTAYAVLMEPLGYILSTLTFLAAWQVLIEGEKWRKTAVVAIIGTGAMYLLFVYLLGVALPEGMFE